MNLNVGHCFPFVHYHHHVTKGRKEGKKEEQRQGENDKRVNTTIQMSFPLYKMQSSMYVVECDCLKAYSIELSTTMIPLPLVNDTLNL